MLNIPTPDGRPDRGSPKLVSILRDKSLLKVLWNKINLNEPRKF